MDDFCRLVESQKLIRNSMRTNVHPDQPMRIDKNGTKWLARGPYSNSFSSGPLVEKAQEWFPQCNAVCVNRKSADFPPMARHKDRRNKLPESHVLIWGDFPENEGALVVENEDGTEERLTERRVWHTREFAKQWHHVEPHTTGVRWSAIAFTR